ncbi:MAG: 50S ribosomal protein L22 [Spirochaetaceae bacterium]|jgi:large subunit ribosomal protein L22|nr:50S ribosomal protein L22 [Spirochaetaceae bacterium]
MVQNGYVAVSKFLFASPTKVRPVADVVRNKSCPIAMAILKNMPQKGARLIHATMKSAISNALNANAKLDEGMLMVKEIRVDEGPRLKRVWFRGRGRADMLLKRMCHITIVVDEARGE